MRIKQGEKWRRGEIRGSHPYFISRREPAAATVTDGNKKLQSRQTLLSHRCPPQEVTETMRPVTISYVQSDTQKGSIYMDKKGKVAKKRQATIDGTYPITPLGLLLTERNWRLLLKNASVLFTDACK